MGGEFLREAGVLVIVLAPLELLVTSGTLTTRQAVVTITVAGVCLTIRFWLGLEER